MNYNFDTVVNRYGTNSLKYDFVQKYGKPKDVIPMWVADMDFSAPPEVVKGIQKAAAHGIFGYTEPKAPYFEAVSKWFDSRFGFKAQQNEIIKTPGVVFALAVAVRAFTEPGDAVLIQTPVYHPFYDVILDNGRQLITNALVYGEDGKYTIDFDDFEQKISQSKVRLFILCSPHNPVGRVWTRQELEKISEICKKHNVTVVSDEIHCDFIWANTTHTCFGTIDENAVITTAPSKTFNLAGLQCANIFIKNAELREAFAEELRRSGYSQLNTLGLVACESAYKEGSPWLDELKAYILGNISITKEFLKTKLPRIRLVEPEGTYLLWLDFSLYGLTQQELDKRVTHGAGLWLSSGTSFGEDGKGFMRLNAACPKATLKIALDRLYTCFRTA